MTGARFMSRSDRVKALRRAIAKLEGRVAKSMAHIQEPRPRDLERWGAMDREIATLQHTLAEVLAGRDPPASPRTGALAAELPDTVEGKRHADV